MNRLSLPLAVLAMLLTLTVCRAENALESFSITMHNVEIREQIGSDLALIADSQSYSVKIVPHKDGRVVFALSGIGYASTARVPGLVFGLKITGYSGDYVIHPTYSIDDNNRDVRVMNDTLVYRRIYGTLPVWFDQRVDSIRLEYFNSMELPLKQYCGIHDLMVIPFQKVCANPELEFKDDGSVMIGIDGSSSIDKRERAIIGRQLLGVVRSSVMKGDTNALCIMEFGTDIHALVESSNERELAHAIKRYKRDKHNRSENTRFTNWSVAFDEALDRKPDLFIFITDGWSNWHQQRETSFSAQFEVLVAKCNALKKNGTRVLFITAGLDTYDTSKTNLRPFLNGSDTRELRAVEFDENMGLSGVDLVTMDEFQQMEQIDLASLIRQRNAIAEAEIEQIVD